LEALVEKINALGILGMDREYHNPRIADGTQWRLLIKCGGEAKSIYCDNRFPRPIEKLAAYVDEAILEQVAGTVAAVPYPAGRNRLHESELWDSIR
jgi:hypothetical protein